jgi:hypothetical protein
LKIEPLREAPDVVRDGRANLTEADGTVRGIDFEFETDVEVLRAMAIPQTFKARAFEPHRLAVLKKDTNANEPAEFTIRYSTQALIYFRAGSYFGTKALNPDPDRID